MTDTPAEGAPDQGQRNDDPRVLVIGPDGMAASASNADGEGDEDARDLTSLVEEPAKVMRIGSMIRQLLEEVKAAPLDEPGRQRLAQILHTSLTELKDGLAPELDDELDRLVQPFDQTTPTESELRIAQAQLVGWLEGLFHGIQTTLFAQQMAARAQLEQMRRALPPGAFQHEGEDGRQPGASRSGPYL